MRIRRVSDTGDMLFGQGQGDYWHDVPDGVALHVLDRLMLWRGQWFADLTQGCPWQTEVLGERTRWTRDLVVRGTVQDTPHVTDIVQYASSTDVNLREWTAAMIIDTDYGAVALRAGRLPGTVPPLPVPPGRPTAPVLALGLTGANIAAGHADLTKPGPAVIADFEIRRIDGKTW